MSATSHPVVSVITPAYNAANFLADTIASALSQTFQDFELLIADDGSTDRTIEIAREWERRDPRVRIFTQANAGTSRARNLAMQHARGRFFALLDSDDLWMPEYLAAQMQIFDQHPGVDVVTGNAYNFGGCFDGEPLLPVEPACRQLSLVEMITHENTVTILSVFKRAVADAIGGFEDQVAQNEDYDYWIRAAQAGFIFIRNPVPLAYYRRRPDSKSSDEIANLDGILFVLERARDRGGARDPMTSAAINRQLQRFEQRRLLVSAKDHLRRRDFEIAARDFTELSNLNRDASWRMIAAASRHAPGALLWAHDLSLMLRAKARAVTRRYTTKKIS